ncbi:hypothetical protein CYANOKiyG1_70200 [Okeania sp. KiyG1]|nr:hypothetical protein CYANOKiyG1_70200 [Okeania sp. KiyG1]
MFFPMFNYNEKEPQDQLWPPEKIKAVTDFLGTATQAAGGSIGKETVIAIMEWPVEKIKSVNELLNTATQAAGHPLGKNDVVHIIKSFGIPNTSTPRLTSLLKSFSNKNLQLVVAVLPYIIRIAKALSKILVLYFIRLF